jgi:hypothetical protein
MALYVGRNEYELRSCGVDEEQVQANQLSTRKGMNLAPSLPIHGLAVG